MKGEEMKTQRHLVLAVLTATALLAGCETLQQTLGAKRPDARLTGLKFADVKLDSATLLFDVEVDNPYPVALPLTDLDYSLSSGAQSFLTGRAELQSTVPAKSKRTVSLPANVDYLGIFTALAGVRPGSKIPYKADLGLSVDAPALGPVTLPLKKEGELVLPTLSDTGLKDILDGIRLQQAD